MTSSYLSSTYKFIPNVDAYLSKINYKGSIEPTIDTLTGIQLHHLKTIPYENLDIFLIGKVSIDPEDVERKIVFQDRGGHCFEHNVYFMWVLRALGFDVTPVMARNRWAKPVDIMSPLAHVVLKVNINNVLYLCDVGYPGNVSSSPLLIHYEGEQLTSHDTHRVIEYNDTAYMNQILVQGEWKDIFVFTLSESYPFDWEIGNYYVTNCTTFNLYENIIVSFMDDNKRFILFNNKLTIRDKDGATETSEIWSQSEFLKVLKDIFKIKLPEDCVLKPRNIDWK